MSQSKQTIRVKPISYQPTKEEMLLDVSVPVSPEHLVRAAIKGGAERKD